MFGLGVTELVVVGILLVLVLGPAASRRLFGRGRSLWTDYRKIRAILRNPLGSLIGGGHDKDDRPR